MRVFKHIPGTFFITLLALFITACEGGEANYSFEQVVEQQKLANVEDLIHGTIDFITKETMFVDQDGNVVTTIKADTSENIVYSIVGGADRDLFTIDERTGEISFVSTPAYSSLMPNIYEVIIGATTASGELSTLRMLVTVAEDITKVDPIIDFAVTNIDAVSSTSVITQIKARPANESDYLRYEVKGVDADSFTIDDEGNLLFKQPLPDYRTTPNKVYNIYVEVTDGNSNITTTDTIVITLVGNRDEIRPVIESNTFTVAENALGNLQIEVTTLGTGAVVKYMLSGVDAAEFSIDASGILKFNEAKDFELLNNTYNINVQVEDDKGNLSDLKAVIVSIANIDEQYDFQSIADLTVLAGTQSVTKVTATSRVLINTTTKYSLNNYADVFEIDENGNLQFKSIAVEGEVYDVEVLAVSYVTGTEDLINGSQTISPAFKVTVVKNPELIAPTINSNYLTTTSVEAPIDTNAVITSVIASIGAGSSATSVSYTTRGDNASSFRVDNSGNLYFEGGVNYVEGGENIYSVIVDVTDDNGNVTSTDVINVELLQDPITIIPVITKTTYSTRENELGNILLEASAEGNGVITGFSIVGGVDAGYFDYVAGYLTFNAVPDYESTSHNSAYHLDVVAINSRTLSSEVTSIVVNVEDVNEQLIFTSLDQFNYTENTDFSTTVTTSPIAGTTVHYFVVSDVFNIDELTGVLTFKGTAPIYTVGGNNDYTVQVTAETQYNGSRTTSPIINVSVLPADRSISFEVTASDNSIFDQYGEVHLDQNTDTDITIKATSQVTTDISYSIDGDSNIFEIDPTSGVMTISAPEYIYSDVAEINTYRAAVIATANDGFNTSDRLAGIMHVKEIDGTPVFNSSSSFSVNENTKIIGAVQAILPAVVGSTLKYSIDGGADSGLFKIDENTGLLSFWNAEDYENPSYGKHTYNVDVRVRDVKLANVLNTAVQSIVVTVGDVDETISFVNVSDFSVDEGTTVTRTLSATSAAGYKMSYSVQSGYDSEIAVTVDPDSGLLSVRGADYHFYVIFNPNYHTITVVATDPYGNKVSQNIEIRVRS